MWNRGGLGPKAVCDTDDDHDATMVWVPLNWPQKGGREEGRGGGGGRRYYYCRKSIGHKIFIESQMQNRFD